MQRDQTMGTPNRREFLQSSVPTVLAGAGLVGLGPLNEVRSEANQAEKRPRIKIGQIGVGHAHASKLSVYRASSDYEVVGIVEPDAKLRERAETQRVFQGVPWMTQDQLLALPDLQAVLVETRVRDLLSTAEGCVKAGKHVHIDKPAGESLPHFRRILESADRQNLLVQMGYMYRYNPAVVLLREFLREGWLGNVFEVHTVMSKVVDPASRKGLAEYPGGIMFELGCHILDLVVGVLGAPQAVAPYSQHVGTQDDGLNDNMLAVLSYPSSLATIKSSAVEVDGGSRRHFVVCGTEGTFHIQPLDNPKAHVTLSRARGIYRQGAQEITFPKYERYVDDAAEMAQVIRGEKKSRFPSSHDLAVQTALLQACGMSLE